MASTTRGEAAVTRITPRRAYLDDLWFALDDPVREVMPRYLDYITVAVPCEKGEP